MRVQNLSWGISFNNRSPDNSLRRSRSSRDNSLGRSRSTDSRSNPGNTGRAERRSRRLRASNPFRRTNAGGACSGHMRVRATASSNALHRRHRRRLLARLAREIKTVGKATVSSLSRSRLVRRKFEGKHLTIPRTPRAEGATSAYLAGRFVGRNAIADRADKAWRSSAKP